MRNIGFILIAILPVFLLGVKKENKIINKNSQHNENTLGVTAREFKDSTRSNWIGTGPRPIRVIIWYPGESGSEKELVDDGETKVIFFKDGKISSKASKYPLILISPGSGQNAQSMRWLGYYLSLNGYITVGISHNGTAEEERQKGPMTLSDFCIWERPKDLSVVLNNLLSDSFFAGRIDSERIGSAGFSLGGAVAIWIAGARLNPDSLHKNAPPPPPMLMASINEYLELSKTDTIIQNSLKRADNSFKDKRIKAVFALAPAVGYGFTKEGLGGVDVPVMIAVGDKDPIAPLEKNAKRYSLYIKNSELIVLPGERGHYLKPITESERSKELREVSELALKFFNEKLRSK